MPADIPPRERLIELFQTALAAVRGDRLTEAALANADFSHVIALGKAAEALAAGAWRAAFSASFPPRRESGLEAGFLGCPRGYATGELPAAAPFERHEGAHPVPDKASLEAGAALLRFVAALPPEARVAVLLSGGASACIELPIPGVTLDFLRRANRWLIASGLSIKDINRVRAKLSRLKGGGLAQALAHLEARAWVISDVAGDALEWVGGGPAAPLPPGSMPALPDWLNDRLVPPPKDAAPRLSLHRLAGNEAAVAAVANAGAQPMGELAGDAGEAGIRIGRELSAAEPGCHVWGGETTVRLPNEPGRGGRCQHLALAAAMQMAGRDDCFLLAASTDGWDGTGPVAGACVDGGTIERGKAAGLDARRSLEAADAGSFLAATGDVLRAGPTGTNVNDLVIACKH